MKVRVCPNCGKHNEEGTFNCADCGTTLSLKTLMDTGSGQLLNVKPIAGYMELADISPAFEPDVVQILKTLKESHEDIVWGCNVAQISRSDPYFFGYIVITSQRLIYVQFESESKRLGRRIVPKRPYLEFWPTRGSLISAIVVQYPHLVQDLHSAQHSQSSLTPIEVSSRKIRIELMNDLSSNRFESTGDTDISFISLIATFRKGNEISVAFYGAHQAEKARKLLDVQLKK